MKNIMIIIVLVTIFNSLTGCTLLHDESESNITQWDFDHQLQFMQTQLATNRYQLKIIANKRANFARMSTFLLRKSYQLCHQYAYQLEILQGVEGFDDRHAMPNYIFPSLVANVECRVKVESGIKPDKL